MRCTQMLRGRQCHVAAMKDSERCHKHQDQTLFARVARRCGVTSGVVESVANTLIDEMGWPEIHAFNHDYGQSVYEDAGGFFLRKIGRLIGSKPKHEIVTYQSAMKAMLAKGALHQ